MMKKPFSAFICILTIIIISTPALAAPRDEAEPGEAYNIIYYEEFNYDNTADTDSVLKLLGWTALSKANKTAINDPTANLAIVNGKLYVKNHISGGKDSYFMILNERSMTAPWMKDYTVQFDVTLTSSGDNLRYIALLTDYAESTKGYYHSFHLRINGSANNQARINSTWSTFDAPGKYYAADQDDSDGTSSIAKKVLGKDFDGTPLLKNVSLTVRIVNEKMDIGPRVYIRNNSAGGDFVLVSRAGGVDESDITSGAYKQTGGKAIVLKAGGTINGYVDNIVVYRGCGEPVWDEIKTPETTAESETSALPETSPTTEDTSVPDATSSSEAEAPPKQSGCASALPASAVFIAALAGLVMMRRSFEKY